MSDVKIFLFPGFPNVGKSSVINGLVGKKVVSVSRTPGHTKYFQTYYLTPTVKLCDCPGLVFPSQVNKQLQVLAYMLVFVYEPICIFDFTRLSKLNRDLICVEQHLMNFLGDGLLIIQCHLFSLKAFW